MVCDDCSYYNSKNKCTYYIEKRFYNEFFDHLREQGILLENIYMKKRPEHCPILVKEMKYKIEEVKKIVE